MICTDACRVSVRTGSVVHKRGCERESGVVTYERVFV